MAQNNWMDEKIGMKKESSRIRGKMLKIRNEGDLEDEM
jgi:hypothetical protein